MGNFVSSLTGLGDAIFGSGWTQRLATNAVQAGNEAVFRSHSTEAMKIFNAAKAADIFSEEAVEGFTKNLNAAKQIGSREYSDELQKIIYDNVRGAAKEGSELAKSVSKFVGESGTGGKYHSFIQAYNKGGGGVAGAEKFFEKAAGEGVGLEGVMGYFGDAKHGSFRTKAAIGAYAGGALGLRVLSGGDLTHNARGENDIAGIPFV